jgi:hypothetical protein
VSKSDDKKMQKETQGGLDRFEPGAELGPVEDRKEYELQMNALPPEQQQLAEESTRFADLCQYFSQQRVDLPSEIVEQVGRLATLALPERIRAMKNINQALMEHLHDIGQDSGIRQ